MFQISSIICSLFESAQCTAHYARFPDNKWVVVRYRVECYDEAKKKKARRTNKDTKTCSQNFKDHIACKTSQMTKVDRRQWKVIISMVGECLRKHCNISTHGWMLMHPKNIRNKVNDENLPNLCRYFIALAIKYIFCELNWLVTIRNNVFNVQSSVDISSWYREFIYMMNINRRFIEIQRHTSVFSHSVSFEHINIFIQMANFAWVDTDGQFGRNFQILSSHSIWCNNKMNCRT